MFDGFINKFDMLNQLSNIHIIVNVPTEIETIYYKYDNGDEFQEIKPLNLTTTIKELIDKRKKTFIDTDLYNAVFNNEDTDKIYTLIIDFKNKISKEIKDLIRTKINNKEGNEIANKIIIEVR